MDRASAPTPPIVDDNANLMDDIGSGNEEKDELVSEMIQSEVCDVEGTRKLFKVNGSVVGWHFQNRKRHIWWGARTSACNICKSGTPDEPACTASFYRPPPTSSDCPMCFLRIGIRTKSIGM